MYNSYPNSFENNNIINDGMRMKKKMGEGKYNEYEIRILTHDIMYAESFCIRFC